MATNPLLEPDLVESFKRAGLWKSVTLWDLAIQASSERTAVVCPRNGPVSYGQLIEEAIGLSGALVAAGVEPGSVVCLQLPNWYEFVLCHLALTRLGAVTLPVLPSYRYRELRFITEAAGAMGVIGAPSFKACPELTLYDQLATEIHSVRFRWAVDDSDLSLRDRARRSFGGGHAPPSVDHDDVTLMVPTSGTTGDSKLVMHSHRSTLGGVLDEIARNIVGLTEDDIIMMPSPLSHMTGLQYGVRMSILVGCPLVLMDRWDVDNAALLIGKYGVTYTQGATPFLYDVVHSGEQERAQMQSLQYFTCGGAPIPEVLAATATERFPNIALMAAWGLSETGSVTLVRPDDPIEKVTGSDGRGVRGWEVRVASEEGEPLPAGEVGEIECRGAALFHGYYRRPDLTAEAMRNGWFRTGDRGRFDDDGYIRCLDRIKDLIIRGGLNISAVEIEGLLRHHPQIKDVAIVGTPDDRLGERICAVIVPRGELPTVEDLSIFLLNKGLSKQKLPESVVGVDALPTSPTGKIQKFVIREQLAAVADPGH